MNQAPSLAADDRFGADAYGRRKLPTSSIWADHAKASIRRMAVSAKPPSVRMRASRAKLAGLQDTMATRATFEAARACACARAPERGGSRITAENRSNSEP